MPPVRRSMLFTPVNVRRFVEGVWRHSADVVVLDLEDSVTPEEKPAARTVVREVIALVQRGGAEAALRVNHDQVEADCIAGVWPGLSAIVLPKAETAEQVRTTRRTALAARGGSGHRRRRGGDHADGGVGK